MFKVKGQRSRSQGQRSRSQCKVMYQQQKRYNTAMDRFSDILTWRRIYSGKGLWLGRPQVAMHSQLPRFLVSIIFRSLSGERRGTWRPAWSHSPRDGRVQWTHCWTRTGCDRTRRRRWAETRATSVHRDKRITTVGIASSTYRAI